MTSACGSAACSASSDASAEASTRSRTAIHASTLIVRGVFEHRAPYRQALRQRVQQPSGSSRRDLALDAGTQRYDRVLKEAGAVCRAHRVPASGLRTRCQRCRDSCCSYATRALSEQRHGRAGCGVVLEGVRFGPGDALFFEVVERLRDASAGRALTVASRSSETTPACSSSMGEVWHWVS
jgi:hypothetical protein